LTAVSANVVVHKECVGVSARGVTATSEQEYLIQLEATGSSRGVSRLQLLLITSVTLPPEGAGRYVEVD